MDVDQILEGISYKIYSIVFFRMKVFLHKDLLFESSVYPLLYTNSLLLGHKYP